MKCSFPLHYTWIPLLPASTTFAVASSEPLEGDGLISITTQDGRGADSYVRGNELATRNFGDQPVIAIKSFPTGIKKGYPPIMKSPLLYDLNFVASVLNPAVISPNVQLRHQIVTTEVD